MAARSNSDEARQPAGADGQRWLRTDRVLAAAAVVLLAWAIGDVLLLVFAGIILAVGLDGLAVELSDRTPLSRGWAAVVVVLLIVVLLAAFGIALVPQFVAQLGELQENIDEAIEFVQGWLASMGLTQDMVEQADANGQEQVAEVARTMIERLAAWGMTTLGALASFVVFLAIGIFALANPGLYRGGLLKLVPPDYRPLGDETMSALGRALRWWFLSQLISMLLLGVTVALGLWVIGIELWLGLALLTALLTFIPYIGPMIAAIPILIVGFAEGVQTGLIVAVFYLVVQNVEANIVVPLIQHKVVHLAPVLAISVQVLLGVVFGLPGIILAAPLTVVAMVAVQKLYVEAVLGEGPEIEAD